MAIGDPSTTVVAKNIFIPHQRQLRVLFIIVLILTLVVMVTFSASFLDVVTFRTKTTAGQQKSDNDVRVDRGESVEVNQEPKDEIIYEIRNQKIREVCGKVKTTRPLLVRNRQAKVPLSYWLKNWTAMRSEEIMSTEMPNTSHFSIGRSLGSMGCFPSKVASSSLIAAFLTAEHGLKLPINSNTSPHSAGVLLQPKSMAEFERVNATYFKFMFVRHPMRRMLSCYMDKMVVKPYPQLANLWAEIRNHTKSIHCEHQGARQQKQFSYRTDSNTNNTIPTLEEFLEFVLSTDLRGIGFDAHWAPYHSFCTPCSIGYDVIGKLETGQTDFEYVWKKTGLGKRKVPIPWFNRKSSFLPQQSKIKLETERMYYSSLPRELILRFHRMFHLDFEMFDYSINDILSIADYLPIQPEES